MYISNTQKDKKEMLEKIGVSDFKELIKQIPEEFLNPKINLPPALNQMEIYNKMKEISSKNKITKSVVGAGIYERYIPSALKAIISRGEFLTAYTPYQPEASQGILQSIYEYQSSMCSLYEMDCSNASLYDGSTAFAEALKAAIRINPKKKILYSSTINPEYIKVAKTYFANSKDYKFIAIENENGSINPEKLKEIIDDETSCIAISNPNYLGIIEDIEEIAKIAKEKGIISICISDPLSLALLKTPGSAGFDIAVGEGQSLGLPLSYGGPYLGIFTCKKEHIRQMPGRICGMTKDKDGKRGFVLTLQAREQHIRRDKSASNVCTNQALCALSVTIYSALFGPEGLKEIALINHKLAQKAKEELSKLENIKIKFDKPFFNEFVIDLPSPARNIRKKMIKKLNIDPGLDLGHLGSNFKNSMLICLTETKNENDIELLKNSFKEIL